MGIERVSLPMNGYYQQQNTLPAVQDQYMPESIFNQSKNNSSAQNVYNNCTFIVNNSPSPLFGCSPCNSYPLEFDQSADIDRIMGRALMDWIMGSGCNNGQLYPTLPVNTKTSALPSCNPYVSDSYTSYLNTLAPMDLITGSGTYTGGAVSSGTETNSNSKSNDLKDYDAAKSGWKMGSAEGDEIITGLGDKCAEALLKAGVENVDGYNFGCNIARQVLDAGGTKEDAEKYVNEAIQELIKGQDEAIVNTNTTQKIRKELANKEENEVSTAVEPENNTPVVNEKTNTQTKNETNPFGAISNATKAANLISNPVTVPIATVGAFTKAVTNPEESSIAKVVKDPIGSVQKLVSDPIGSIGKFFGGLF